MARYWVIDTNLLVDWCIFEMAEADPNLDLGQTVQRLQFLSLAIYRDFLIEKLGERRATTSHVAGAETGWVGHRLLRRGTSHHFLEAFHRLCHRHQIAIREPDYERVNELARDPQFAQGHADASLVVLSEECQRDGHEPTILTGERALERWCAMNDVSAERFEFRGR